MWTFFSPKSSLIYFPSQGFQALPQIPLLPSGWCSPSVSLFFCLTRPIPQASSITAFPLVQASAASVEWTLVPVWQSGRRGRGKLASFQLEAKATPPNVDFFRRSDPVWSTLLFIKNTCIYFIVMTWTWFSWLGFHEKEHPLNWKCSF